MTKQRSVTLGPANSFPSYWEVVSAADYNALLDTLEDLEESYRISLESPCPDEHHCTCVPALRAEIERLKELNK